MGIQLGALLLDGFEASATVRSGGRQSLTIHRLPGGTRVIDAMGADDDVISWSGFLSGATATDRARTLDAMRAAGEVVGLSWDVFSAQVIVSDLRLEFHNSWWIGYRIGCTVVSGAGPQAGSGFQLTLQNSILADLAAVSGPGIEAAIEAVTAAGASIVGSAAAAAAQTALFAAGTSVSGALGATDAAISGAQDLPDLIAATGQAASLANAAGFVGRAASNFQEGLS